MGILQARILEWVAIPFSRGSSLPTDQTQVSRIAGRFLPYQLSHQESHRPGIKSDWDVSEKVTLLQSFSVLILAGESLWWGPVSHQYHSSPCHFPHLKKMLHLFIWSHQVLVVALRIFTVTCEIFSCGMQLNANSGYRAIALQILHLFLQLCCICGQWYWFSHAGEGKVSS